MTLFRLLRTSLLGKTPFAMTIIANGRVARATSGTAPCFEPLLTQGSGMPERRVYEIQLDRMSTRNIF